MHVLEKYDGMSPKQIHEEHIKQRMKKKADSLRDQIRVENEIRRLSFEEKKQIKLDLLQINGYDKTVPIKNQNMKVRILYFLRLKDFHKNAWVIEHYTGGG